MADFTQSSKVLKFLRGNDFQIKQEALDAIDERVGRMLESIIEGAVEDNIKSIGASDIHRLFVPKSKKNVDVLADKETNCKRCGIIKKPFLEFAMKLQEFTVEEAKILANKHY